MKTLVVTLASLTMVISGSLLANNSNGVLLESEQLVITEDYKEIELAELPASIIEYITENMEDGVISKAFKDTEGNFKVLVELEGTELTKFFDAQGNPVE